METNNKFEALGALEGKSEDQDSPSKDNVVKEITTKKWVNNKFKADKDKAIMDNTGDLNKEQKEIPPMENNKGNDTKPVFPQGQEPFNDEGSANKNQNAST